MLQNWIVLSYLFLELLFGTIPFPDFPKGIVFAQARFQRRMFCEKSLNCEKTEWDTNFLNMSLCFLKRLGIFRKRPFWSCATASCSGRSSRKLCCFPVIWLKINTNNPLFMILTPTYRCIKACLVSLFSRTFCFVVSTIVLFSGLITTCEVFFLNMDLHVGFIFLFLFEEVIYLSRVRCRRTFFCMDVFCRPSHEYVHKITPFIGFEIF